MNFEHLSDGGSRLSVLAELEARRRETLRRAQAGLVQVRLALKLVLTETQTLWDSDSTSRDAFRGGLGLESASLPRLSRSSECAKVQL